MRGVRVRKPKPHALAVHGIDPVRADGGSDDLKTTTLGPINQGMDAPRPVEDLAAAASPCGPSRRPRLLTIALAVATLAALLTVQQGGAAERAGAAGTAPGDGTTMATAGASCWGILRAHPTSPTGPYWLATPAMGRPAFFHCDMTTDGGGWVLIARGRDGWTFGAAGQQSPAAVRSPFSGPAAFAPAALDPATITGVINGASPALLSDGIRVERATNSTGTTKQNVRLFPKFARWNWTWEAGHALAKVTIGATTYAGSNTRDTFSAQPGQTTNALAGQQGLNRLFTWAWANNANRAGFSYGKDGPRGTTSPTSHLYQHASTGYTLPFTSVWLRPRLGNAIAFAPIPATGSTAVSKPAVLKDRSELAPWGVVGLDRTNEQVTEPWKTNVLAVEATANRLYVGGRFTGVKQGPTGAVQAQRSLAAFDLDGNWISTFRPVIAGRVWDLVLTPDNKLIIAGDFTSVNGVADTRGMAALNPTTGAVLSGWKARFSRVNGTEWRVRSLDLRGPWVYAVGLFDRLVAGTSTVPVAVSNGVSIAVSNGAQGPWKPALNGSGFDIAVTQDGNRALVAGNFSAIAGITAHGYFGVTSVATGAPTAGVAAWKPAAADRPKYQQAVADLGSQVVVGGSEHALQLWNAARTTMLDAAIAKPGGDIQALEVVGNKVYVGCHCGGWVYQGTNSFWAPSGFRSIEPINLVGLWDRATWNVDRSWLPTSLKGDYGEGVWAMDTDARGCLWIGGDLTRGAYSGNAAIDYLGGFARFCPADASAPSAPGGPTATSTGQSRRLTWSESNDPGGGVVSYDVIRNGRVIATTSAATLTFTDPSAPAGTQYTVRAVDARGNRSASPAPTTVS